MLGLPCTACRSNWNSGRVRRKSSGLGAAPCRAHGQVPGLQALHTCCTQILACASMHACTPCNACKCRRKRLTKCNTPRPDQGRHARALHVPII
eukprot:1136228-Pelagomonas_calceolata.AAC.4